MEAAGRGIRDAGQRRRAKATGQIVRRINVVIPQVMQAEESKAEQKADASAKRCVEHSPRPGKSAAAGLPAPPGGAGVVPMRAERSSNARAASALAISAARCGEESAATMRRIWVSAGCRMVIWSFKWAVSVESAKGGNNGFQHGAAGQKAPDNQPLIAVLHSRRSAPPVRRQHTAGLRPGSCAGGKACGSKGQNTSQQGTNQYRGKMGGQQAEQFHGGHFAPGGAGCRGSGQGAHLQNRA